MKFTIDQLYGPPMPNDEFAEWYVAEIMPSEFPHFINDLGKESCERKTRMGARYAEHFKIERPDLQGQFLTLMWGLGPNFYEVREFAVILLNEKLTQAAKIDALYEVSDTSGALAAERADDRYWYPWLLETNILNLTEDPEWDFEENDVEPDADAATSIVRVKS